MNTSKKIILAGGSGFIGKELSQYFEKQGVEVIILTRNPKKQNERFWDGKNLDNWKETLEEAWAVINLAGKTINCRFTEKNKKEIIDSRTDSTKIIGKAIMECKKPPKFWLNTSTATLYKESIANELPKTENDNIYDNGFTEEVAKIWERTFDEIFVKETKKAILRTSIVLGKIGGAFPMLLKLAKRGLCTPQASGNQYITWIHILDYCRAVNFILENEIQGIFNMCAPNPVTNKHFNNCLKKKVKPLFTLPQPKWLLEMGAVFVGTETELILKSSNVVPQRFITEGFDFQYKTIETAFDNLI